MESIRILDPTKAVYFYKVIEGILKRAYPKIEEERARQHVIIEFRKLFEDIYIELCQEERRAIGNIFSQVCFITRKYNIPLRINGEAHGFRKLANKVVHEFPPVSMRLLKASLQAMCILIEYFSSKPIPEKLIDLYQSPVPLSLIPKDRKRPPQVAFDRAVVIEIKEGREGDYVSLICESEYEMGNYTLYVRDAGFKNKPAPYGQNFLETARSIWEFSTVHFFNIGRDEKRSSVYHTSYQSLIVLEPDFLVDASYIARSFLQDRYQKKTFRNPHLAYLDRISGVKPNEYLLAGAIVNDLLDDKLVDASLSFQEGFGRGLRKQVWNAVNLSRTKLRDLQENIEYRHWATIQDFAENIKDDRAYIEPTFYSAKYGLQGRPDLLVERRVSERLIDIYELKSGRPSSDANQVKADHQMQVVAYNMLLESSLEKGRNGNSAVLYSKATHTPLRDVTHSFRLEQELMMVRNELVATKFALADRDFSFFQNLSAANFSDFPLFPNQQKMISDLAEAFQIKKPLTRAFFREFHAFVLRELQTSKVGDVNPREGKNKGFSALWHLSKAEKLEGFGVLTELIFLKVDPKDPSRLYFKRAGNNFTDFRKGDIGMTYPQDDDHLKPLSYQILKCTVEEISEEGVVLKLRNRQIDPKRFKLREQWVLEHDQLDKGYYSMLESLNRFLLSDTRKQDVYLGLLEPRFKEHEFVFDVDILGETLSISQGKALKNALAARDFALIQGPPGTGKTSRVLTYLLAHLFRHTNERIVILAFTNKAVEKIIEELGNYNARHKGGKEIDFIHLASAFNKSPNSLPAQAKGKRFSEIRRLLFETRVFIGTIASFQGQQNLIPNSLTLDTLIIDEASQLVEPQVAGIVSRFSRFVMIGDHNQLPAVTIQRKLKMIVDNPELKKIGVENLSTSFFERLWKQAKRKAVNGNETGWEKATVMLQEHFRMHQDIAALVNPYYNNALTVGKKVEQTQKLEPKDTGDKFHNFLQQNRIIFFESPLGQDKSHPVEAKRVAITLKALRTIYGKRFKPGKSVGIITPWRAQINTIRRELKGIKEFESVTVDTVERFQGSQRNTILISLATSDPVYLGILGSLAKNEYEVEVDRKLNVSVSRAEDRLILFGESATLETSPHYRRIINQIKNAGGYLNYHRCIELFGDKAEAEMSEINEQEIIF